MMNQSVNLSIDHITILFQFYSMKQKSIDSTHISMDSFGQREERERERNFTCRIISATFSSPFPVEGIGRANFFERKDIFTFVYLQKHSVVALLSNEFLFFL